VSWVERVGWGEVTCGGVAWPGLAWVVVAWRGWGGVAPVALVVWCGVGCRRWEGVAQVARVGLRVWVAQVVWRGAEWRA